MVEKMSTLSDSSANFSAPHLFTSLETMEGAKNISTSGFKFFSHHPARPFPNNIPDDILSNADAPKLVGLAPGWVCPMTRLLHVFDLELQHQTYGRRELKVRCEKTRRTKRQGELARSSIIYAKGSQPVFFVQVSISCNIDVAIHDAAAFWQFFIVRHNSIV